MHLWGSKKEEKPKKEGKPTEEELLKRDNCKTFELEDGTKFILVGGTHSTGIGGSNWKHYLRVKDFFDSFDYDVLCMEYPILPKYDFDFELKVLKGMAGKIRQDHALWSEIDNLVRMHSLDTEFMKLLGNERGLPLIDFRRMRQILKKIDAQGGLSEESRGKLSKIVKECLKVYLVPYEKGRYQEKQIEELLRSSGQSGGFTAIFLSKAIKNKKDFAICDVEEPSLLFGLLQVFLVGGLAYFTSWLILLGYSLLFMLSSMVLPISSGAFLHEKHGAKVNRLFRAFTAVSNIALYISWKYREAAVALQLLRLSEHFKDANKGHPGTFLYFSHVGHTNGIFSNLKLGTRGLEQKLNSKKFVAYKPFYQDSIFLETSKLDKDRDKYLGIAKEERINLDAL